MDRQRVAILLTSKPNYDEFALKYFILSLNKIQKYYEFFFPELHRCYYTDKKYPSDSLFGLFEEVKSDIEFEKQPDYLVNIITSTIDEDLFYICSGNVSFITTDKWDKDYSPPSLFEYLLLCITANLQTMNKKTEIYDSHHDTIGCCFDYTYYKKDNKVDIALGYICDSCKEKIIAGAGEEYYKEMMHVLSREWIGDLTAFGSVAYNLKKFFKFDIDRDSGFNKTVMDKITENFYEIPKEIIVLVIGAIIGVIFAHYF